MLADEADGGWVVAVFNFDSEHEARKRLTWNRLGIPSPSPLQVTDIWDGLEVELQPDAEFLDVQLSPCEAKLLRVRQL
ncbi:hypothetical protein [Paenibacillus silvisoli]|uniref:hypothetical protein n=1 Tax=Paenibacillus silvisoli TaxID=3110539 RepID=UPI0028050EE1|nr:hypothetical protein [Paenibacillus silvisoli]